MTSCVAIMHKHEARRFSTIKSLCICRFAGQCGSMLCSLHDLLPSWLMYRQSCASQTAQCKTAVSGCLICACQGDPYQSSAPDGES